MGRRQTGSSVDAATSPRELRQAPHWLVYFGAEEINAALARVEELGGTKLGGPIDIQIGSIGVAQDPQGAAFALFAGELEA